MNDNDTLRRNEDLASFLCRIFRAPKSGAESKSISRTLKNPFVARLATRAVITRSNEYESSFSDRKVFAQAIGQPQRAMQFQGVRNAFPMPEAINDDPETALSGLK